MEDSYVQEADKEITPGATEERLNCFCRYPLIIFSRAVYSSLFQSFFIFGYV